MLQYARLSEFSYFGLQLRGQWWFLVIWSSRWLLTVWHTGPDHEDTPSPERPYLPHTSRRAAVRASYGKKRSDECVAPLSPSTRKIEPQQNWLAKLFRVKPATRYLCITMSKRRARQEVAILLREWRQYGMRDVEVDKERNIVFARVGPRNRKLSSIPL